MARVDQKSTFKQLQSLDRRVPLECHPYGTFPCQQRVPPFTLEDVWTLLDTGTLVIIKTQCLELKWCDWMCRTFAVFLPPYWFLPVHSVSDHAGPLLAQFTHAQTSLELLLSMFFMKICVAEMFCCLQVCVGKLLKDCQNSRTSLYTLDFVSSFVGWNKMPLSSSLVPSCKYSKACNLSSL